MIRIHAGNIDIDLKVMTDHESLHILIHNATESKENLRMLSASVKFLKAGFMSKKPRCIAGIAFYNFLNSVIKLLNFVLGSIDLLTLKNNYMFFLRNFVTNVFVFSRTWALDGFRLFLEGH